MTMLLDLLADVGRATWDPFWLPLFVWTLIALPIWATLRQTDHIHPYAEYRIWQMVLATLPIGLLGASVLPSFGPFASVSGGSEWGVIVTPPIKSISRSVSSSDPSLTWLHAIGARLRLQREWVPPQG